MNEILPRSSWFYSGSEAGPQEQEPADVLCE